jgi:hypothetical protein
VSKDALNDLRDEASLASVRVQKFVTSCLTRRHAQLDSTIAAKNSIACEKNPLLVNGARFVVTFKIR